MFCSAGKNPGERAFTRMPCGAHSRARFCVRLTTAAFVAAYVKTRDSGVNAVSDAILMIEPRVPFLNHVFAEDLAGQPHRAEVHVHDAVPFLVRNFEKRRRRVDACPIDKDVGRPVRGREVRGLAVSRPLRFVQSAVKNSALPPSSHEVGRCHRAGCGRGPRRAGAAPTPAIASQTLPPACFSSIFTAVRPAGLSPLRRIQSPCRLRARRGRGWNWPRRVPS